MNNTWLSNNTFLTRDHKALYKGDEYHCLQFIDRESDAPQELVCAQGLPEKRLHDQKLNPGLPCQGHIHLAKLQDQPLPSVLSPSYRNLCQNKNGSLVPSCTGQEGRVGEGN